MASGLAVVGLGARGREWAREIGAHGAFDLAACVDIDPAARAAAQGELALDAARLRASIDEAHAATPLRAVVVATPPEHHAAACRTALEHGLGVLVEKPFTQDLDEAVELVDRAEAAGLPLLVAQSYRHLRVQRAARGVVRSGRLGEIRQVICQHYRIEPEPALQGAHSTLWDLGAHHLDAIRDLMDDEPVAVLADSFDDGLSAQVLLEFANGARATYHATRRSSGHGFFEGGKEHYLRVVGDRGTLHALYRWLLLFESGRAPRLVRRGRRDKTEEAQLLDQLAAALRGTMPDGVTGRANIATMAILDACVRSAAERAWVAPRVGVTADA
jgi:predicted dehydrogenase